MYKLGEMVTDSATGLKGMITHLQVEMDSNRWYRFQPRGLNPETGLPVDGMWITHNRVIGGTEVPDDDRFPFQVLGTEVEDIATGFKGTAVNFVLHSSGCIHISIQPKGALAKTGAPTLQQDFDILRVRGKALKVLPTKEVEKQKRDKPSPSSDRAHSRFSF